MSKQPDFERIALLQGGSGGDYTIYRIPGIVVTAKGTLLAYCEARKGTGGDWCTIDILMRRSTDGGKTWSSPVKINPDGLSVPKNPLAREYDREPSDHIHGNPVAIVDRQLGVVHFVFCAEYAHCFYLQSVDDGITWSPPTEITSAFEGLRPQYNWRVIATGPGHGIQLQRGHHPGRLLVPIWLSTGTGGHPHHPSAVSIIYSDDGGTTWKAGEIVADNGPVIANPNESEAVELADGRVMLNIRNQSPFNRRVVSISTDGATGWSTPLVQHALFEPICFASIQRLSQRPLHKRNRILFSNPDSQATQDPQQTKGRRENLVVKMSYDEGESWPIAKVVDPGPAGYSDLASSADGTIYCFYEDSVVGGNLWLAKFSLAWLTDGADTEL